MGPHTPTRLGLLARQTLPCNISVRVLERYVRLGSR